MKPWLEEHKPGTSSRRQLFLAGAMWSLVGGFLAISGARWAHSGHRELELLVTVLVGLVLGAVKARYVLDPAARRIVARIRERGEGRCAGGFLSLRSWALIAGMILLGRILRKGLLPPMVAGAVYIAIGVGLLLSSRLAWRDWRVARPPARS